MNKTKNIGGLLLDYRMITKEDLDEALRFQKEKGVKLGQALVQLGKVRQDEIDYILSRQVDEPFIILDDINIDTSFVCKFDSEFLINNRIIPIYENDKAVTIVTDDPFNKKAADTIQEITDKEVNITVSHGERIEEILRLVFPKSCKNKLTDVLHNLIKEISDTSFYRVDFFSFPDFLKINIFGFNILHSYPLIEETYTLSQIMLALGSMDINYFYSQHYAEDGSVLHVYPVISGDESALKYPAVLGKFGLPKINEIVFSDLDYSGSGRVLKSNIPVKGYPFYSFRSFSFYEGAVNIVDNLPGSFDEETENIFFDGYLPFNCESCGGKGCDKCGNYGYYFERLKDDVKVSDITTKFSK